MMKESKSQNRFKYQLLSFRWAIKGLTEFFRSEQKAIIHTLISIAVIITAAVLKINLTEWMFVIFATGLVFTTEIINTSLEKIAGIIPDKYDKERGVIKDMAAGAVLFSALSAAAAGLIIFLPKIIQLWKS